MLLNVCIRVGDFARFPLGRLGDEDVYRHRWIAESFTLDGCVVARRLSDGVRRTVSIHWWRHYALDYRALSRDRALPVARALPLPRLNADLAREGFYVSILSDDHPGRHILAAGPFSYPGDADRMVRKVRTFIDHGGYLNGRAWWSIRVGTCKVDNGRIAGRWNHELGLEVQS
jgi:hypothetical protein